MLSFEPIVYAILITLNFKGKTMKTVVYRNKNFISLIKRDTYQAKIKV